MHLCGLYHLAGMLAKAQQFAKYDQSTAFERHRFHVIKKIGIGAGQREIGRIVRDQGNSGKDDMKRIITVATALSLMAFVGQAFAHGDVAPQDVDISGLTPLNGEEHLENPYRDGDDYDAAIGIGDKAYNQNCARCHGLGAVSGGIAPDLRYLIPGEDDEYFVEKVKLGAVRNGVTYMPPFGEIFSDEAIWAIRSWLDTVAEE